LSGLFYSYRVFFYVFFDFKKSNKLIYKNLNKKYYFSYFYTNTSLLSNASIFFLVAASYAISFYILFLFFNKISFFSDFSNFSLNTNYYNFSNKNNNFYLFNLSFINWFVIFFLWSLVFLNWRFTFNLHKTYYLYFFYLFLALCSYSIMQII